MGIRQKVNKALGTKQPFSLCKQTSKKINTIGKKNLQCNQVFFCRLCGPKAMWEWDLASVIYNIEKMFARTLKHPQGGDYTRQNVFQTWQKLTGLAWQIALHKFFIVYTEIIKFLSLPWAIWKENLSKRNVLVCLYFFLSVFPLSIHLFYHVFVVYKNDLCNAYKNTGKQKTTTTKTNSNKTKNKQQKEKNLV